MSSAAASSSFSFLGRLMRRKSDWLREQMASPSPMMAMCGCCSPPTSSSKCAKPPLSTVKGICTFCFSEPICRSKLPEATRRRGCSPVQSCTCKRSVGKSRSISKPKGIRGHLATLAVLVHWVLPPSASSAASSTKESKPCSRNTQRQTWRRRTQVPRDRLRSQAAIAASSSSSVGFSLSVSPASVGVSALWSSRAGSSLGFFALGNRERLDDPGAY
mmetsp:Transcript_49328/g.117582  ORF Transcript_49328/g.117582 Transcript_49328/m.117582 type:complete len:217 (-) Transcript_49328:408-1058(-)